MRAILALVESFETNRFFLARAQGAQQILDLFPVHQGLEIERRHLVQFLHAVTDIFLAPRLARM